MAVKQDFKRTRT